MLISKCIVLCVSDVDTIAVCGDGLIPDPHIGDFRICRVAIESRLYVPFQIDTSCIRINGVVPAVHHFTVQRKTDTLGIALSKTYPVADVKNRFSGFLRGWLGGLRLFCRFGGFRCRWCRLFFFSRGSGFRSAFGLVCFLSRFAWLWQHCRAVVSLIGNLCWLGGTFRYAGRRFDCGFGFLLCCALELLSLRFLCCLRRFRLVGNFFTFRRRNRGRLFGDWRGVAAPHGQTQKSDEKKNCDFGFHTLHSLRPHSTRWELLRQRCVLKRNFSSYRQNAVFRIVRSPFALR